jgi:hypothetical protein
MPTAQTSKATSQERARARRLNSIILIAATSYRLSRCSSDFVIQSTTNFALPATHRSATILSTQSRPPRGALILDSPVHLPWNGYRRHTGGVET